MRCRRGVAPTKSTFYVAVYLNLNIKALRDFNFFLKFPEKKTKLR